MRIYRRWLAAKAEGRISLDDFLKVDEAILAGTTIEVLPIVSVDGQPIGSGEPGPIARKLQEAYRVAVEQWLAPRASMV